MNREKILRRAQDLRRVAVGLSGGVDSAVSALLLKQQGYEVAGVHLYCWPPKSEYLGGNAPSNPPLKLRGGRESYEEQLRAEWIKKNGCRADEDKKAALKTALEIGIPFKTLDFSEEYNRRVVDYFYREYEAGRTPNPDVMCNSEIKFGLFLDWAMKNGFDYMATGHYAKIGQTLGSAPTRLFIPADRHKDQTYFLWKLTQKELAHILFPLGDLEKSEVRKIAKEAGLSVAARPDSQGICFVGNVEARKFLARRLKVKKGEVKNISGEVIGIHDGVWFYTIGQRGGWTINSKTQKLLAKPDLASQDKNSKTRKGDMTPVFYVISKDAVKNELVVGVGEETKRQKFEVIEANWMVEKTQKLKNSKTQNVFVRIRHGGKLIKSKVERLKDKVVVEMREAQRGVAPGQSAVFYGEDGELLGGGVIA